MKKLALSILLLNACYTAFGQCLLQKINLSERVNSSALIVEGEVVSQFCLDNRATNKIYTANVVRVLKVMRNDVVVPDYITVFTYGGRLGDRIERAYPSLQFSIGEVGVFILSKTSTLHYTECTKELSGEKELKGRFGISGPSSFIKYDLISQRAIDAFETFPTVEAVLSELETLNGEEYEERASFQFPKRTANKRNGISGFSPDTISAGTGALLTITGTGFGSQPGKVSFANADDGGRSTIAYEEAIHLTRWTDTEIQIIVPENAGTGSLYVTTASSSIYTSSTPIYIPYAHISLIEDGPSTNPGEREYYPTLENDNDEGGYSWQISKNMFQNKDAVKDLVSALEKWRCSTGVNFNIDTLQSVNTTASSRDGIQCLMFNTVPGLLGITYLGWTSCASNNDYDWYLSSIDIEFNDQIKWSYGADAPGTDEYSFESVALHEFGHAHQLGHLINQDDVMHYAIYRGIETRKLKQISNTAGGKEMLKRSTYSVPCIGVSRMEEIDGSCKLRKRIELTANFQLSKYNACVGDTLLIKNLSEPAGAKPVWILPSGVQILQEWGSGDSIEVVVESAGRLFFELKIQLGAREESALKVCNVAANPRFEAGIQDVSCFGEKDGSVTLSLLEGLAPFELAWKDEINTSVTRSNLAKGVYEYSCVDDNTCSVSGSVRIREPNVLEVVTAKTDATWAGLARGKAYVMVEGGTKPYLYLWNDAKGQTTDTASGLSAGTYKVTVSDSNQCQVERSVSVAELTSLNPQVHMEHLFHPNPASDRIYVQNSENAFEMLVIFNLAGQEVLRAATESENTVISLEGLASGSYSVLLMGPKGTVRAILVKQ